MRTRILKEVSVYLAIIMAIVAGQGTPGRLAHSDDRLRIF
jgi:hypothetical protein